MGISDRIVESAASPAPILHEYRLSPALIPALAHAVDLIGLGVAALAVWATPGWPRPEPREFAVSITVVAALYATLAVSGKAYHVASVMRPGRCFDDILIGLGLSTGLLCGVLLGFGHLDPALWARLAATTCAALILIVAGRYGLRWGVIRMWRRRIVGSSMVVLGAGEQAARFLSRMAATKPYLCTIVGVFDPDRPDRRGQFEGHPLLGDIDELIAHVRTRKIDDVVVAMPWSDDRRIAELVERLKELPINVHLSTDLIGYDLATTPAMGRYDELPLFEVVQRPISGLHSALKTAEDYILAGTALILISPLLLMIAIAIKLDSPGPVFFMQKRLGFNNKPFSIYKFRSMYHQTIPESVVRQARRDDPRVTRVGRFIRATSLDELPQLLNVLNGTMSLVGPRPHALSHNEEYGRQIRGYFARHRVKPGITGWAQVNGLRGETEALDLMAARVRHDVYYANNWSLLFDVRILVLTVATVLFQKTAY